MTLRQLLNKYEPASVKDLGAPIAEWKDARGARVGEYIDFTSGLLTANIGHDNPAVMRAVRECRGWSGWYAPSKARLEAYETLVSILPAHLNKYLLLSTGSEAIDCALKIADDNGGTLVTHSRSYHGSTIGAEWASGYGGQRKWFIDKPAQLDSLHAITKPAILLESFIGPYCEWYSDAMIWHLKELQREKKAIIIFDEMQAGFGRTGKWFGFEHYDIKPDIVVGGKAAAGGFPFAFVAGRAELLDRNPQADYISTFSGNPIGCAAFVATVAEVRKLLPGVEALEWIVARAAQEMENAGLISSYSGCGLAWSLFTERSARVVAEARKRGLLLLDTNRGTVKIAPPLCIGREDLRAGLEIVREVLNGKE